MSESSATPPRPVSLVTIVVLFAFLGLFAYLAGRSVRDLPAAPQNQAPDNLSKDNAWKATPQLRRQYLDELRAKQAAQASAYAWIVRPEGGKPGVVQLPIDRAVELIIQEHPPVKLEPSMPARVIAAPPFNFTQAQLVQPQPARPQPVQPQPVQPGMPVQQAQPVPHVQTSP